MDKVGEEGKAGILCGFQRNGNFGTGGLLSFHIQSREGANR